MPDVIEQGQNGLLVDWDSEQIASAILQLLDDTVQYQAIAQAGQQSVQKFDADITIRDYALAYHAIIEQYSLKSE